MSDIDSSKIKFRLLRPGAETRAFRRLHANTMTDINPSIIKLKIRPYRPGGEGNAWQIERLGFRSNPLSFDDSARQSGLYILGKPRMGKSWFMVNLMIQDREARHGIFFIDPHGDAIDKLLENLSYSDGPKRILLERTDLQDTLLLDPEDPAFSFGINLLECHDISDIKARNDTFNRAKGVFDKLWNNTFEEKPWLQLILENTIYAFIENQGYTLAEFPYFYRDSRFREAIAKNMRYNRNVKNYWLDFGFRSKRLQEEQLEAAHTRIETMLGHEYVTDIVGQSRTTINFKEILERNYILLVKLSTHMSDESKRIIGTILVSELLHAIQHRRTRDQFCIYIDEFQNFANFHDFPTLITQAPKFGIATTLAHHERYGQLAGNPQIIGATAAIANKVLFQITARDAHELAPEFADAPPTEARMEEQFILSRAPIYDLLKWHDNPKVREYVNKYLRPLKERLEDIMGEAEAERLIRTEYLDEANLYRIDDQMEGGGRFPNSDPERRPLISAGRLVNQADQQTRRLRSLNEEVAHIRRTFRGLNKLFVAMMEGSIDPHSAEFFNYIMTGIAGIANLTDFEFQAIKYYLSSKWSGGHITQIPYDIAKAYDLVPARVKDKEEEALRIRDTNLRRLQEETGKLWDFDLPERYRKACIIPKPRDITTDFDSWDIKNVLDTIYKKNEGIIRKIQELVNICSLLSAPENHIITKSGQHVTKQVNTRTEQDMVGERARELMALPKYTVYVKKLENARATKAYRTTTKELPEAKANYDEIDRMIRRTRESVCRRRYDIQDEIYNREMPVTEDSEPPSAYD